MEHMAVTIGDSFIVISTNFLCDRDDTYREYSWYEYLPSVCSIHIASVTSPAAL
jgi:hypothetical protein